MAEKTPNTELSDGQLLDLLRAEFQPQGRRAAQLGSLVKEFETGKALGTVSEDIATISPGGDDPGGKSYGTFQLASKVGTLQMFLNSAEGADFVDNFKGLKPGSPKFDKTWKAVASRDPLRFENAQHNFVERTHFTPAAAEAQNLGFDVNDRAVQEFLWSASIQHRGVKTILKNAAADASGADPVKRLYDSRSQYVKGLKLPPSIKSAVLSRFDREQSKLSEFQREQALQSIQPQAQQEQAIQELQQQVTAGIAPAPTIFEPQKVLQQLGEEEQLRGRVADLTDEQLLQALEIPISDAPPAGELSDEELTGALQEPTSDLFNAAKFGFTRQTITGRVLLGIPKLADNFFTQIFPQLPEMDKLVSESVGFDVKLADIATNATPGSVAGLLKAFDETIPEHFQPSTAGEQGVAFVTSFVDPALGPAFKTAQRVGKPIVSAALQFAPKVASRSNTLRRLKFGVEGGVGLGTFEMGNIVLDKASGEDVTIGDAALRIGSSALLGGLMGSAGANLGRAQKLRDIKTGRRVRQQFEAPIRKADPLANRQSIRKAAKVVTELEQTEKAIERNFAALQKPNLTNAETQLRRELIMGNIEKYELQQKKFADVIRGPEFEAFQSARARFGNATVQKGGKAVPAFKQAVSDRNVILDNETMNHYLGVPEIGKTRASAFGFQDITRTVQEMDGVARGRIRIEVLEPITNAFVKMQIRSQELKANIVGLAQALPNSSKERMATIFRAAEGRATKEEVASFVPSERQFLNFTKTTYSDLINEINTINKSMNLPLIRKRKNYMTHLQELNFWEKLGVRPGRESVFQGSKFAKKTKTTFRFEKRRRTGEFAEDPVQALTAYIDPALRRAMLQRPASEAQARVNLLRPNARETMTRWLEGPVLGGIDPKDASFLNNVPEIWLKGAEAVSKSLGSSVILGNMGIVVQQPSQVIGTMHLSNIGHTLRGLASGAANPPRSLMNQSTFLTGRTVLDDVAQFKPGVFKKFQDFAGAITNIADKYVARSSWNAGFTYGKDKLMLSDQAAVRYADDVGRMLHANYQDLYKPAILRGRVGKAFFPFQSFAFNLWSHLVKDPKVMGQLRDRSRGFETAKVIGSMLATNQIYDALNLAPPFEVGLASVPLVRSLGFGIPSPPLDFLFREGQAIASTDPRNRAKAIYGNILMAATAEDDDQREAALKRLLKVGGKFIPLGLQIRNTVEGVEAVKQGYYEVGHEDVDIKGLDRSIAILLGPNKTKAVREARKLQEAGRDE